LRDVPLADLVAAFNDRVTSNPTQATPHEPDPEPLERTDDAYARWVEIQKWDAALRKRELEPLRVKLDAALAPWETWLPALEAGWQQDGAPTCANAEQMDIPERLVEKARASNLIGQFGGA
jgi:hypothetical protein